MKGKDIGETTKRERGVGGDCKATLKKGVRIVDVRFRMMEFICNAL